jgi:hypothetical protein
MVRNLAYGSANLDDSFLVQGSTILRKLFVTLQTAEAGCAQTKTANIAIEP